MKLKNIFLGTPEFGAIILEGLVNYKPYSGRWPNGPFRPILVITEPDKPVGRKQVLTPPPVKLLTEKYKINIIQPAEIRNSKSEIRNLKPDLIICAAYGQIIPGEILRIPRYGCLNVHPSLLPKYRGPSPIQAAILNGDEETGVTIILMDEKMDHGPIISNSKFQMGPSRRLGGRRAGWSPNSKLNFEELMKELANLGAKLLLETIPKWMNGEIKPYAQDDSKATFTKIIKKEDGKIDWSKSAEEIERKIQAFYPWPGTFAFWDLKKGYLKMLKILEADLLLFQTEKRIGEVFLTNNKKITVQTGQNCLILQKLQLEGKKPLSAENFLMGHNQIIGAILK